MKIFTVQLVYILTIKYFFKYFFSNTKNNKNSLFFKKKYFFLLFVFFLNRCTFLSCAKRRRTGPITWRTRTRLLIRTRPITDRTCCADDKRTGNYPRTSKVSRFLWDKSVRVFLLVAIVRHLIAHERNENDTCNAYDISRVSESGTFRLTLDISVFPFTSFLFSSFTYFVLLFRVT